MEKNRREIIAAALTNKGTTRPCSRCGGTGLEIVAETNIPIQENPNNFVIGGPSIPAVVVACSNCGHLWHHAIGSLNLLRN